MTIIKQIMFAAFVSSSIGAIATTPTVPVRIVETADINVASPAGLATLNHRLKVAVREACTSEIQSGFNTSSNERDCRTAATAAAQAQLATILQKGAPVQVAAR
jgi:UrcA family protein